MRKKDKRNKRLSVVKPNAKKEKQEQNLIDVTNGELRNLAFIDRNNPAATAYGRLMTSSAIRSGAKFKLKKLFLRVSETLSVFEEVRKELIDKYAKKDKEGEFIMKPPEDADGKPDKDAPRNEWVHDFTEENEKEFQKEFEDLLKEKADISGEKPTFDENDEVDKLLNVIEMNFLSPLMNFPDE